MKTQYLPIAWPTYHDYVRKLAASLLTYNIPIEKIVAISRGGLTFGHLLSDFLRAPIFTFSIQSFTDIQKQGVLKITEPLKAPIEGKHVLLVDDVADSGTTLKRAVSYLNDFSPKKVTTLTMFYKPHSVIRPDLFAKQVPDAKWIIFPYEITETIFSLSQSMTKQGAQKADIQKKLLSLGFTIDQIKFVRKYYLPK